MEKNEKQLASPKYNLFLDDVRSCQDVFNYKKDPVYLKEEWVIVRDYKSFVGCIEENGVPEMISFDHDLGPEHYEDLFSNKNWDKEDSAIDLDYDSYNEKTGYHAATWLVEYCLDHNIALPKCYVHTQNPVGMNNITLCLNNYAKYHREKNPEQDVL